eukprot:15476925-Alexandrium_andersonii.AAC.1
MPAQPSCRSPLALRHSPRLCRALWSCSGPSRALPGPPRLSVAFCACAEPFAPTQPTCLYLET